MDGESAWNMGDKFYMLVLAIKEQFVTAVQMEEPRIMLKWAQCLMDEVYPACTTEERAMLKKELEESEQAVWSVPSSDKGLYDDDDDQARSHYEAMKAASALYRHLNELMFAKKMVIPWEGKKDLGRTALALED